MGCDRGRLDGQQTHCPVEMSTPEQHAKVIPAAEVTSYGCSSEGRSLLGDLRFVIYGDIQTEWIPRQVLARNTFRNSVLFMANTTEVNNNKAMKNLIRSLITPNYSTYVN